ncbi:MAG: ribonuclease III [Verrucomicrobiales bacterium]|nr:ribonuclease III [Verrucomicrobiales bacterium]
METLETLIGHTFKDRRLLAEALTHASLCRRRDGPRVSNQRLEFLGDSVVGLLLAEALYERCPDGDEGVLTRWRAQLVSAQALAARARELNLGSYLSMDAGEANSGGRERESILADALEALIAAVYLDQGLTATRRMVLRLFEKPLAELVKGGGAPAADANPKGHLQEMLQAINQETPRYELLQSSGPDHDRWFEVRVIWGEKELGRGRGRSKKEAEAEAARQGLRHPVLSKNPA